MPVTLRYFCKLQFTVYRVYTMFSAVEKKQTITVLIYIFLLNVFFPFFLSIYDFFYVFRFLVRLKKKIHTMTGLLLTDNNDSVTGLVYNRVQWFSTFFRFYHMLVFHELDLLVLRPFVKKKFIRPRPTECTRAPFSKRAEPLGA